MIAAIYCNLTCVKHNTGILIEVISYSPQHSSQGRFESLYRGLRCGGDSMRGGYYHPLTGPYFLSLLSLDLQNICCLSPTLLSHCMPHPSWLTLLFGVGFYPQPDWQVLGARSVAGLLGCPSALVSGSWLPLTLSQVLPSGE